MFFLDCRFQGLPNSGNELWVKGGIRNFAEGDFFIGWWEPEEE